ncbi:hypothetical protein INR49_010120 [Caranx melampygus]|nr:hypothetical protein INR49_010120 [Caranx melampygus]
MNRCFLFFLQVLPNESFCFTCKVRSTPRPENPHSRTPYYQYGSRTLSPVDRSTSRIKTHSSLEVKKKDKPLPCDREEGISIQYTVVGEEQAVDVIYLVSLEFSPSSAVPGDETTLQLTAQPNSLCGVSAVDQSVHLKEPGKTLTAEKIFDLLPVTKASALPHEVQDVTTCRRWQRELYFALHHDAVSVFQSVGLQVATNLLNENSVCPRLEKDTTI